MYKNAWKCHRCPKSNDEKGCPAWIEYSETNIITGEVRITKECSFQAMPKFLVKVIEASNRPAAAVESTRNEIAAGFGRVISSIQNSVAFAASAPSNRIAKDVRHAINGPDSDKSEFIPNNTDLVTSG